MLMTMTRRMEDDRQIWIRESSDEDIGPLEAETDDVNLQNLP